MPRPVSSCVKYCRTRRSYGVLLSLAMRTSIFVRASRPNSVSIPCGCCFTWKTPSGRMQRGSSHSAYQTTIASTDFAIRIDLKLFVPMWHGTDGDPAAQTSDEVRFVYDARQLGTKRPAPSNENNDVTPFSTVATTSVDYTMQYTGTTHTETSVQPDTNTKPTEGVRLCQVQRVTHPLPEHYLARPSIPISHQSDGDVQNCPIRVSRQGGGVPQKYDRLIGGKSCAISRLPVFNSSVAPRDSDRLTTGYRFTQAARRRTTTVYLKLLPA